MDNLKCTIDGNALLDKPAVAPGEDLAELASQHKQSLPPKLRHIAPHLPAGVARLVHCMLAKDPLRRPQNPRELIDILARLEIETFSERA